MVKNYWGGSTENWHFDQIKIERFVKNRLSYFGAKNHLPLPELQTQIWTEESTDIPLSLKQALSQDKGSHPLLLKSKGYTSNIIAVCDTLDRNMKELFDDLKIYLVEEIDNRNASTLTLEDRQRIAGFLKDASREGISQ